MSSNVDGVVSKLLELRDYVRDKEPQIICLTESKLTQMILNDTIAIEGYNTWRKDRNSKKGGGVIILIKNELQVRETEINSQPQVELLALEIKTTEGNLIVANVYMPPMTNT